jgi:hypothetical protein
MTPHDPTLCRRCQRPLHRSQSRRWLVLGGLGVVALAGIGVTRLARSDRYDRWDTRAKGDFELQVLARRNGAGLKLSRYDQDVRPGDRIGFVITGAPDDHPYLMVASTDGKDVNVYFPYGGPQSAPIPGPGRWEVPGSIELDGSLGYERIFAFFSRTPLAAATVRTALTRLQGMNTIRDARTAPLPDTIQRSFLIFKRL